MADLMGLVKALKDKAVAQYGKGAPYREALASALRGDTQGINQALSKSDLTPADFAGFVGGIKSKVPMEAINFNEHPFLHQLAQERAALPISEGGLGLPINNTAMDRAKAMGFDINAYHGTNKDIYAFDPTKGEYNRTGTGTWFSKNPLIANTYGGRNEGSVYPVMIRSEKLAKTDFQGNPWVAPPEDLTITHASGEEFYPPRMINNKNISVNDIARMANKEGNAGIQINRIQDYGPYQEGSNAILPDMSNNVTMFDPTQIRSRFAAFDPFRRNEADILAGVGVGLPFIDYNKK
jgi:hypothetical protein